MQKFGSLLVGLFVYVSVIAQVGQAFPSLTGETVKNESITIPTDTQEKYTLVGMAYSKKAEADLNTWFSPVYQKFIFKSKKPSLFGSFGYDVNVYFVPMFTGVKAAGQGTAKKQALKKVDERLFPHILFYKGELKKYKQELALNEKDTPYFFIIDKEGKIIHRTSGAYSEEKMDEVESVIEED